MYLIVYCLLSNSIDYVDDADLLDQISDASTRIVNTATQLDSTIYTMVFIPNDSGEDVTPSVLKYQKQSKDFLNELNNDLDTLLKAGTEKQLSTAQEIANKEIPTYPKFLFKDTNSLIKKETTY